MHFHQCVLISALGTYGLQKTPLAPAEPAFLMFSPRIRVHSFYSSPVNCTLPSTLVMPYNSNKQNPDFTKTSAALCHFQTFSPLSHHHDLMLFCRLIAELNLWGCAVIAGNEAPEDF